MSLFGDQDADSKPMPAGHRRQRYDYRVCQVQNSHVTFVNGAWQGKLPIAGNDSNAAIESCLSCWEYLHREGALGWELVTALGTVGSSQMYQLLYLKRVLD